MRTFNKLSLLTPLLVLSLTGCDSDKDEDGLLKSEEIELGTDPDVADTDGDTINDGDEVGMGTDPTKADTDGDGIDDGEEGTLGLDPLLADTDGDGASDGEEIAADSDPTNKWSWPAGLTEWPDFSEGAAAGSQYAVGEVLPDVSGTDQFGNSVSLAQFNGAVILLDFSAGWCGPCQSAAANAEALYQKYNEEGFVIVHAMIDDWTRDGTLDDDTFLATWADEFGLTFPVMSPDSRTVLDGLYGAGLYEGYIPTFIVLDRDRSIAGGYGGGEEAAIEAKIESLLAGE